MIEKRFVQSPSKFCLTLSKCLWWALYQMDTRDKSKASGAPGYFFTTKLKNIPRVCFCLSFISQTLLWQMWSEGWKRNSRSSAASTVSIGGLLQTSSVLLMMSWEGRWVSAVIGLFNESATHQQYWSREQKQASRNSALARPLSKFRRSASSSPEDVFRYRFAGL